MQEAWCGGLLGPSCFSSDYFLIHLLSVPNDFSLPEHTPKLIKLEIYELLYDYCDSPINTQLLNDDFL